MKNTPMLLENFYNIVDSGKEGEWYITRVNINREHEIYKGHFPNRPVTPGVILMQLFKDEAERQNNCKLQLIKATNVKFMAVVDPNQNELFELYSTIEREGDKILVKGTGKQGDVISLKLDASYEIVE